MKQLAMYEILAQCAMLDSEEQQINFLKTHWSKHLAETLALVYDERVHWLMPKETPPYTPYEPSQGENDAKMTLHQEASRGKLYYFVHAGKGQNVNSLQRENMFINLLEMVHPKDAELLIMFNRKELPQGITRELIEKAYGVYE